MITVNKRPVTIQHFPDGTQKLNLDTHKLGSREYPTLAEISWHYQDDSELSTLYFINEHLRQAGFDIITLKMPYIPNARFDRVKNPDEVFTLKHFAKCINNMNFTNVIVLDPHSYVSEALFNNLIIQRADPLVKNVLDELYKQSINPTLFFPDEGAMKRYGHLAEYDDSPFAFGIKNRDWATGNILGLTLSGDTDAIAGQDILIIDDICSKGGTFYHSAEALKKAGANDIYLYITHCENTILDGKILTSGLIRHIYTTNSLLTIDHPMITKITL